MTQRSVTPMMGKAYARVIGRQLDRFVEFEFFLNDEELCLELIMPDEAFKEFCINNNVELLPPKIEQTDELDRIPGLYRAPANDTAQ